MGYGEEHEAHLEQQVAFERLFKEAQDAAPVRYGNSLPRAILGVTLQKVPRRQWEAWARFCYARGQSLVEAAIDEWQRLREICYNHGLNDEVGY